MALWLFESWGYHIIQNTNEWHSNASGHAEYDIYQDGRFDESISVITSLDEYGNISDYIY